MEAPNQFQLELAVDGYLQQLQTKGNYTQDDIMELKSHLLDNVDELKQKQLSDEEAFIIAKKRLGKDEVLHAEYKKVNGIFFYNRDLFVIVLSICTYLLFSYLYTISQNGLQYLAISGGKNIYLFGVINYVLQIAIVGGFIYLVFNNTIYLNKIGKLFSTSPANFSAILIVLIVILYFIDFNFQKAAGRHLSADGIRELFFHFAIDSDLSSLIRILLGSSVLVAILAAFVTSYKKVKFLDNIINNSGYITLFCLGFFWDAVAASARMLSGASNHNVFISTLAFSIIWFIGMLIFNLHLNQKIFMRNLIFISFGFILEFSAGMWMNPGLRYSLLVSVYFIALIVGGAFGFLTAQYFKRKSKLVSRQ